MSLKLAEEAIDVAKCFEFLKHPAEGVVTFFNNCGMNVQVKTYDQADTVQWVSYATMNVASKAVVQLQARGTEFIHVYVGNSTYTPELGKAYVFDGHSLVEYTK